MLVNSQNMCGTNTTIHTGFTKARIHSGTRCDGPVSDLT